jgi:hypothetical protein
LSPDVWVPGSAEPSLEAFVSRVLRQIERYTVTLSAERTHVEVELGDGERLVLRSLSSEPGYGFLTLAVHAADGEAEELIVPVGSIRRISLGPADEERRPGFALPSDQERGPDPAA